MTTRHALINFDWLIGLVLRHINHCRSFNAKSFLYRWRSLFQTIQFITSTQVIPIWPIESILSGSITPGQSGSGSDGNKGVLGIPQSSKITGASPSDCLESYIRTFFGGVVLLLCRFGVSVLYSLSRLGQDWWNILLAINQSQNNGVCLKIFQIRNFKFCWYIINWMFFYSCKLFVEN